MPEQAQTCLMTQSNTLWYMGSFEVPPEVPPEVPDLVMLVFMGQLSGQIKSGTCISGHHYHLQLSQITSPAGSDGSVGPMSTLSTPSACRMTGLQP
jgi:hypothetical protein